jgi:hypothetical protein
MPTPTRILLLRNRVKNTLSVSKMKPCAHSWCILVVGVIVTVLFVSTSARNWGNDVSDWNTGIKDTAIVSIVLPTPETYDMTPLSLLLQYL